MRQARRLGDKPAIIEGPTGRVVTYRELDEAIRRVATGLARRGVRQGDVVAIYSPNCPEYVVVFHAVASLGAINTTVNPLYTADELAGQLRDAKARFLITFPPFLERARDAGGAHGHRGDLRHRVGRRRALDRRAHGVPAEPAGRRHRPGEGPRRAALLERHDRAAQGRHADAPPSGRESAAVRGHAGLRVLRRAGHGHGRAAVLPHLRHGRDHEAVARRTAARWSRCPASTSWSSWASSRSTA